MFVIDQEKNPHKIQQICFEEGAHYPKFAPTTVHLAFELNDLAEAIKG